MSGAQGHVLNHVVRRGVQYVASSDAFQKYEEGRSAEDDWEDLNSRMIEFMPLIIAGLIAFVVISAIGYTVGEVVASLAMIESPVNTAIIEDLPPAYADEPDAPLYKDDLLPSEAVADLGLVIEKRVPVTTSLKSTVRLLHATGGWWARFRGLGLSYLYHAVHGFGLNAFMAFLGADIFTHAAGFILISVATSRLHMTWTHSMIAMPGKTTWRRFISTKNSSPVLLASAVHAAAQQATVMLPLAVAFFFRLPDLSREHMEKLAESDDCTEMFMLLLRVLAVPATAIFVALGVLLPATVALTRVEALMLPEEEETVVPFDRQAIVASLDSTRRCKSGALYVAAWRSIDSAARGRVLKVYVKMVAMQLWVILTAGFVASIFLF